MRTSLRILLAAACGLGAALTAPVKPKTPAVPEIVFPLHLEAQLEYDGEIAGPPRRAGDLVVFATNSGKVYGLDVAKKAFAWQADAGAALAGVWAPGPETIIVRDVDGRLLGFSRRGSLRWVRAPSEIPAGDLGSYEGRVFFITTEGTLFLIQPDTGENAWGYRLGRRYAFAVVCPDRGFGLATNGRELEFLHPSGRPAGEATLPAPLAGSPYAEAGALYLSFTDNTFRRLDAGPLAWRWSVKTGRPVAAPPISDDKRIYFVTENNVLYGLNKKSGETVWWKSVPGRAAFSPSLSGTRVFLTSRSPRLAAYAKTDGQEVGSFNVPGVLQASPMSFDRRIVVHVFDPAASKSACLLLAGESPKAAEPKKK
jgi:outer membrane protein assembly factor BamB